MELQNTPNRKSNLEKKDVGGIMLLDFKLYHKARVINRVLYCHEIKSVDQSKIIEISEINSCTHGHLFMTKESKYKMGKGQSFQ